MKQLKYQSNRQMINELQKEREKMNKEEVICIAEEFSEWLENMAEKYGWDKDDIQDLIRQFLM